MPSKPPLPHLLIPYVSSLPSSSLTIVSSVLGATGNWLVLRFLYAALSVSPGFDVEAGHPPHDGDVKKGCKVVLVSFMRGWEFWKSEAKRLGLDLTRLTEKCRFAYVDALSELFNTGTTSNAARSQPLGTATSQIASPRRPQGLPASMLPRQSVLVNNDATLNQTAMETGPVKRLRFSGSGPAALDVLERDIVSVINQLKTPTQGDGEESEVLLVVDQPDLLLAATGLGKGIGATEMEEWVMGLQQAASATVMTISSDSPLIHNASAFTHQTATPLEREHAALAIGLAHRAEQVLQLRNLETGAARDVSGVLRASKGGAWGRRRDVSSQDNWEEKEVLYFIQRDGGVSVFRRGE